MILEQVLQLVNEENLNEIKVAVLQILDEKIKNRYYINKHFQNAIMNYFLEDYGSHYLREQYEKQSNREVRRHLTCLSQERGYKGTKYMIMMNIYFDVHSSFDLVDEYRSLLKTVALQPNTFSPDSQEYISQAWKKAFGLFVLAHTFDRSLNSIFDIWNSLFIDQKIFRKRRPNSKTTSQLQQNSENTEAQQIKQNDESESAENNDSNKELSSTKRHKIHIPLISLKKQDTSIGKSQSTLGDSACDSHSTGSQTQINNQQIQQSQSGNNQFLQPQQLLPFSNPMIFQQQLQQLYLQQQLSQQLQCQQSFNFPPSSQFNNMQNVLSQQFYIGSSYFGLNPQFLAIQQQQQQLAAFIEQQQQNYNQLLLQAHLSTQQTATS